MKDSAKEHEKKKTKKQAAEARGEAKAMTAVGVAGGGAWGLAEMAPLFEAWTVFPTDLASTSTSSKHKTPSHHTPNTNYRKIGIAAGVIAIGALIYAAVKHQHAHDLEAKHPNDEDDWKTRIEKQRALTKEETIGI